MQQETIIEQELKVAPEEVEVFKPKLVKNERHGVEPAKPSDDSVDYKLDLAVRDAFERLNDFEYHGGPGLEPERVVQLAERMKLKDGKPATEKDRVIFEALTLDAAVNSLNQEVEHELRNSSAERAFYVDEIDDLKGQKFQLDEMVDRLAAKNARQERYLQVGAGVGAAAAVAGIVAYMRQKKAHESVMKVLEETALLLDSEVAETVHFDFDGLIAEVFDKIGSMEVRSFRHPFAIKLSELERAMNLLVGLLRTAETLTLQYANLKVVAPIDVEFEPVNEETKEDAEQ